MSRKPDRREDKATPAKNATVRSNYVPKGERFLHWQPAIQSLGTPSAEYSYAVPRPYQPVTVLRYDKPNGSKTFHVLTLYRDGTYIDFPDTPYRLYDEMRVKSSDTVIVCEGEKATEAINSPGIIATTSLGGPLKAALTDWSPMEGKDVVILRDFDEKRLAYAEDVAQLSLASGAKSAKIVTLPGLDVGDGPVEWIGGRTRPEHRFLLQAQLDRIIAETPLETLKRPPTLAKPIGLPVNSRCLSDIESKTLEWVWDGVIPQGKLTLLAGEPSVGKSFVAMDIIARHSCGEKFPNSEKPSQPGAVILFAAEDTIADTVRPRLDAAGADVTQILLIGGGVDSQADAYEVEPWSFQLDRDLPSLEAELRRLQILEIAVRLIVIDPISSCLEHADRRDDPEMNRTVLRLVELAARSGAAILLVSHGNGPGTGGRSPNLSANRALVAAARSVWVVVRDHDDSKRRMMLPVKTNLCEEMPGLTFSIQEGLVQWETEPVRLSAGDFLAKPPHSTRTSLRDGYGNELPRAVEWLKHRLEGGPVLSCIVRREAYANDLSEITLRRALERLGCKTGREIGSRHWHWRLCAHETVSVLQSTESGSNAAHVDQ